MGKDIDEIVVKMYPEKKQLIFQQRRTNLLEFPSCKENWIEFEKFIIVGIVQIFPLNKFIKLTKNYLGKIIVFY